ncbi:hypothetical protein [Wansuia hejianensis]|uniref:Uncharacterized protein n=1 Tax=Wansuia hejianensis TaxID=2763667 RepID=A0A926IGQ8_9FIRM|nr:hypothetical protein [Wansuia hejianensis]MBC8589827.1 hypothetical protein [Wansuia hejianensis]
MIKLQKALTFLIIIFFVSLLLIPVSSYFKIELGQGYVKIFGIIFILLCIVGLTLSFISIYKSFKNHPILTIRTMVFRFLIILTMSLLIDFLKSKSIDLKYGLFYGLIYTIVSFYVDERYIKGGFKEDI